VPGVTGEDLVVGSIDERKRTARQRYQRRLARYMVVLAILGVWVAFAAYIWPTKYRAISLAPGAAEEVLAARENRFTGDVQILTVGGWKPLH
jgi:hypothetical protein